MNSITQELKYKQSIVKYALRNGVTAASIVYKKHRKTIYRWINKYDGTIASLANKSRRPHRCKICTKDIYDQRIDRKK